MTSLTHHVFIMYTLERNNGRLCSLGSNDFGDVWRGGSALKIPLKGGEEKGDVQSHTHNGPRSYAHRTGPGN
jgi:hypothetical protein